MIQSNLQWLFVSRLVKVVLPSFSCCPLASLNPSTVGGWSWPWKTPLSDIFGNTLNTWIDGTNKQFRLLWNSLNQSCPRRNDCMDDSQREFYSLGLLTFNTTQPWYVSNRRKKLVLLGINVSGCWFVARCLHFCRYVYQLIQKTWLPTRHPALGHDYPLPCRPDIREDFGMALTPPEVSKSCCWSHAM